MPSRTLPANVSVIIPAHQAAATIERALLSVGRQTVKPTEIVVVDDGSSDGTTEAARSAASRLGRITVQVVAQQHLGPGAARNHGLRLAACDVVAFLDADDEWLENKIEATLPYLEDDSPDYELVGHDYIAVREFHERVVECARLFAKAPDPYVALYRKGILATSTVMAKRTSLLEAGGFDETLPNAQDFDLWLRVLQSKNRRFHIFGSALTRYHVTGVSVTSNTQTRVACGLEIAERHFASLASRTAGPWRSFWYRIVAVHYEGIRAYLAQGRPLRSALLLAALPIRLTISSLRLCLSQSRPRHGVGRS